MILERSVAVSDRCAFPDHGEVRLIDSADPGRNPNPDLVLAQAAGTVAALRAEGRTVLVHCVEAGVAIRRA